VKLYRAVVEDNDSPLKDGRVRVRIYGIHTEKNEHSGDEFEYVRTSELPWAEVIGGNSFSLIAGVGLTSVLRQGSWVWVVLENEDPNRPVIIGTINGKNNGSPVGVHASGLGFVDPDEVNPITVRANEDDTNRLARVENLDEQYYKEPCPILGLNTTIHNKINSTLDVQSGITDGITGADVSQTEPNSTNDSSVYPEVNVLETQSGHVLELDDSAGNERIRVYHRTGSYIEIKPDGTFVQKSVNTDSASHYIHMSDVEEHIAKGVKKYIEDNLDEIIKGGIRQSVEMDSFHHVGGLFKITADGHVLIDGDVRIEGKLEVTGTGKIDMDLECGGMVADEIGDLDSLRQAYDNHHHIGNLGVPTSNPIITDPKDRTTVDAWQDGSVGFK
jgi:hypothetical protein